MCVVSIKQQPCFFSLWAAKRSLPSMIYLRDFSMFLRRKRGPEWSLNNKKCFLSSLKIPKGSLQPPALRRPRVLTTAPPPKRERKKSSQFSTKAIFSHEGMSTVVNYRISVSGPFQYTAPTRAPEWVNSLEIWGSVLLAEAHRLHLLVSWVPLCWSVSISLRTCNLSPESNYIFTVQATEYSYVFN